jgi:LPS-assembly protein
LLIFAGLLLAATHAHAQGQPFDLTAATVSYESSPTRIVAHGNVVISSTQGVLQAPLLTYWPETGRVVASQGVTFTDPTRKVITAQAMELTDKFRQGAADKLTLAVPVLGEIITARAAQKLSPTAYQFQGVTYSPCAKCADHPQAWSVQASRIDYDVSASRLTYRNAVFRVADTPVMYLPWFSNTIGPKQPKSGLLLPTFGHSSSRGTELGQKAYIWSPGENADYTLGTRYMSARGPMFTAERRQVTDTTQSELRASYLNDLDQHSRPRADVQVMAEKVLKPGQRIGLNAEHASDRTYLNEFFGRTDPYLASTAYGEDAGPNHYYALTATRFENLSSTTPAATTAQVMPHLALERTLHMGHGGDTLTLTGDALNLSRDTGPRYRRLIAMAAYDKPFLLADGSKVNFGATLRGDNYDVGGSANNGDTARVLPETTLLWSKPYISPGGNHTIAPTVMGALSPRGGNPAGIPNEDSVDYELDVTNLFEPSRYAGLDRVETGPRLVYGLDNRWGTPDVTRWRLFLGQSLRKYDDNRLPLTGGAATAVSDWVGAIQASPNKWFDFNQSFRLDNSDLTVRRADSGLRIGETGHTRLILSHTYLQNGPQELDLDGQAPLNQNWMAILRGRNDIANNTLLEGEAGFRYTADCYQVEFMLRRRGFESADLHPSTDYLINLKLLTFGGSDTPLDQTAEGTSLDTMSTNLLK